MEKQKDLYKRIKNADSQKKEIGKDRGWEARVNVINHSLIFANCLPREHCDIFMLALQTGMVPSN